MPTNAMGRDRDRPGNTGASSGGRGSNADKDRAARAAMGAALGGAGRPDRIAMNLDFVTPSYDWSQANIGNFGIGGAIANMFKGIAAGNTYNQGMPKGFVGGQSMGHGNADAGQMFMPGGFIGVNRAPYMADMKGAQKMFMPPQPPMAGAPQQQKPKFAGSMFRPGYNFMQGGA